MSGNPTLANGEFGDLGGFAHEDFLIRFQAAFQKGNPNEVDLFNTFDRFASDLDEVLGKYEATVGEHVQPHALRIARDGTIRLFFKTTEASIIGIDALATKDIIPTAWDAACAITHLEGSAMSFRMIYDDNKRAIGHRLPIVRRLNEALEAGEAVATLSHKQREEVKREEFYKAQSNDENGMF